MVQPPQDLHLCMSVCACHWIALLKTACSTLPVCHPSYKPRTLVKVRDPKAPLAHLPGSSILFLFTSARQDADFSLSCCSSRAFATGHRSSEGDRGALLAKTNNLPKLYTTSVSRSKQEQLTKRVHWQTADLEGMQKRTKFRALFEESRQNSRCDRFVMKTKLMVPPYQRLHY